MTRELTTLPQTPLPAYRCAALIALAVVLAGGARDARADGWKIQLQGVKALGLGYAGRAVAEDATVVWFNPAGMTELDAPWTLTFGGAFIHFALDYTDFGSRSLLGQPLSGPASVNGGKPAPVPHFYAVRKLNDRWWAGVGINFPHGLEDDYEELWVGRYHATNSRLRVANLNGVMAVKVNDSVSLGLGVDVQRSTTTLGNMLDFGSFGAALGLPLAPQVHDGRIEVHATDWAVGYDASLAWQVTPRARFASTYRSQIEHTLKGTAEFTVPSTASVFTAGGAFTPSGVTLSLPMPRELSGSFAYDLTPEWTVVTDLTWTDWSRFERLEVAFENAAQPGLAQDASFEDSVRGAAGIIYRATDRWTLRSGWLYEHTPVPDATRTPRLPEVNNVGFAVGGSYRLNARSDLDFSWSHLIPHDAPVRLADPAAGLLSGSVEWKTDALSVGFNTRF